MIFTLQKQHYLVQNFISASKRIPLRNVHLHKQVILKLARHGLLPQCYQICFHASQLHTSVTSYGMKIKETPVGSKYCRPSWPEIIEQNLHDEFRDKEELSIEEWDDFKNKFLLQYLTVSDEQFDSVVMNAFLSLNNFLLAQSFMKYLKAVSYKPNFVTCMKYMNLCSKNMDICKQDEILKTYQRIKKVIDSSPVLDATTVDCIVKGLCATSEWMLAFDYLNKLPIESMNCTKDALACAALRNNDENLGWSIISEWYKSAAGIGQQVFCEYAKLVSRMYPTDVRTADSLCTKLLNFLRSKNITLKSALAKEIANCFQSDLDWDVKFTKVNKLGICNGCKRQLQSCELNPSEFQQLKAAFFQKAVYKSDFFINTTEHEFRQFITFIEHRKPFDIVVDGLNAACSNEDDVFQSRKARAVQLLHVVNQLSLTFKRILILGRNHMKPWPRNIMNTINRKAEIFLTSNESQDDPFLIYAALVSGPKTLFVSSDLMRDHMSRLRELSLIQLFQKWQQSHQVYVSSNEDGPVFIGPLKHSMCIQGCMDNGWHIPYDDEFILDPYEVMNNWLCIQKNNSRWPTDF